MIKIHQLNKRFGGVHAVANLDLEIEAGEVFGLLGPNGAGKTTTLQIISGLLAPSSGWVTVCGYDVTTQRSDAQRRMGYIPDHPFVYEKLTGRELLGFVTELYGLDRDVAQEDSERWLKFFDMDARADELIEGYSHGMKQRIVLAATLLPDPKVLVLDEPMVGLDPRGARLLRGLMRSRRDAGKTVLISTHTLEAAEQTCDRIGIMNRGQLVQLGTLAELRNRSTRSGSSLESIFLEMTETVPPTAAAEATGT